MSTNEHTKTVERFMAKVARQTNGCWNWTGGTDRKGYGKFSMGNSRNADGTRRNSMVSAHRVAYMLFVGDIPTGNGFHGTCVLHKCDNPACVNPQHLFIGSNAENVHDMDKKGRRVSKTARGEAHPNAKLTAEKVADIKRMLKAGFTRNEAACAIGCGLASVHQIATGRQWAHVVI